MLAQTHPVDAIAVAIDAQKVGAWETRNRAMSMSTSKWIGFLDDDDEFLPHHLRTLIDLAVDTQASVTWGWFEVVGGTDPFPQHRGRKFDIAEPHIFPITALVNRELIMDARASFAPDPDSTGTWEVQDFPFWKALWDAGGKFVCTPEITWKWHHHGGNTSGRPDRW